MSSTAISTALPMADSGESTTIQCGMCNHMFDPVQNAGCSGCPMNDGCLLACCPSCGYSMPNPAQSRLLAFARAVGGAAGSLLRPRRSTAPEPPPPGGGTVLSKVKPGNSVRVVEIGEGAGSWHERLQAYGIAPGRVLHVVQQSPVTVVRVDHVDLAFEARIARHIVVE